MKKKYISNVKEIVQNTYTIDQTVAEKFFQGQNKKPFRATQRIIHFLVI